MQTKSIVAAIQMCSSPNIDENLQVAEKLMTEAALHGANLVVLPEMFSIMGTAQDKVTEKEVFNAGKVQSFLSEQALKNKIWLVGGTIPIESQNKNKVRAASLVFNSSGEIVARYDKIHLFDVELPKNETYKESDTIEAGRDITVVDSPFGKIGLAVCYDVRFPELFRILFNKGAQIICLPSAFTVTTGKAHWEALLRSRAIENFCYIIGSAQGGQHKNGRATYGNSLIVNPWGSIVSRIEGTSPGVIYSEIDLDKLTEIRKSIPVAAHQKIFFDTSMLS